MRLSEKIKELRNQHNLSMRQMYPVSSASQCRIEHGDDFEFSQLIAIADICNLEVWQLLVGVDLSEYLMKSMDKFDARSAAMTRSYNNDNDN